MGEFISKKTKIKLGLVGLAILGALASKCILDIHNYKVLNNINHKIK